MTPVRAKRPFRLSPWPMLCLALVLPALVWQAGETVPAVLVFTVSVAVMEFFRRTGHSPDKGEEVC